MRIRRTMLVLLVAMLASGAALGTEQCDVADWFELGAQDALNGLPPQHVDHHARACNLAGVSAGTRAWSAGHAQALPRFCTAGSGYVQGARNTTYHGKCPGDLEQDFLYGYGLGQDVYKLELRIGQIGEQISVLREKMNAGDITADQRKSIPESVDYYKQLREGMQALRLEFLAQARAHGYPVAD